MPKTSAYEGQSADPDVRLYAPATQRNRAPILQVLARVLPGIGTVLEVASGSGEHAVWFSQHLRPLVWQPSDPDPACRRSIAAHAAAAGCATLRPPLDLDVTAAVWPIDHAAAVVCINLVHIAPWAAAKGLFAGAARLLPPAGVLFLYGPFLQADKETAPSNLAFDRSLRARNTAWGLRGTTDMAALGRALSLRLEETIEMPANNLSLVFRRA